MLNAGYALVGLAAARVPPNATTDAMAHFIAARQLADGRFRSPDPGRLPLEGSDVTATALAIRALHVYAPPALEAETARIIRRARDWLLSAQPIGTEEKASQLRGLGWADVDQDQGVRRRLSAALVAEQRVDGGWAQLPDLASDAYATGQVLAALHDAGGLAATSPAYRKGMIFLLKSQHADGSWLGIVHRDLKPGNIILTRTGAKLLDFGLAKPASGIAGEASLRPTTESSHVTAEGAIVGTLQYMAPEQLEGANADARTDIFAFGAIVYEMLTGRKAFEGKSQAGLIAAIMQGEAPAITAEQPLPPPALDRIVKTCLAKDPDDRWQSARDLSRELRWVRRDPGAAVVSKRKQAWIPWAAAAVLALALTSFAARVLTRDESPAHVTRFRVDAPAGTSLPAASQPYSPTISPDGTPAGLQVRRDNRPHLAMRSLDALESQVIPGTEGGRWPFWAPDSRVIAFFAEREAQESQRRWWTRTDHL